MIWAIDSGKHPLLGSVDSELCGIRRNPSNSPYLTIVINKHAYYQSTFTSIIILTNHWLADLFDKQLCWDTNPPSKSSLMTAWVNGKAPKESTCISTINLNDPPTIKTGWMCNLVEVIFHGWTHPTWILY